MELVAKYKVPIIITSLGARVDINEAIHAYGGVVMHDVITNAFAHKAIKGRRWPDRGGCGCWWPCRS